MKTKVGIHLANGHADHSSVIQEIGSGCYTMLHHEDHLLPEITQKFPEALVLIRYYLQNWWGTNAEAWAKECALLYNARHKMYTKHVTWANEQNLADESGGIIGATSWGRKASKSDYEQIAAWNLRFIKSFKVLCPDAVLHYPAMAAGHSDDQDDYGFIGLEICREGIDLCQILDVHCYPKLWASIGDEFLGASRVEKNHNLFPDKPLFISECGNFEVTKPNTSAHYEAMCWTWNKLPYIIGWTFFIASDPTGAHGQNDMSRNTDILATLSRLTKSIYLKRNDGIIIPGGSTVPATNVGQGFQRASNLLGGFLEDEVYHFPGSENEVSLAIGKDGYATWSPKTNTVVVIRWNGQIYSDGGNNGNGRFVRVL